MDQMASRCEKNIDYFEEYLINDMCIYILTHFVWTHCVCRKLYTYSSKYTLDFCLFIHRIYNPSCKQI